MAKAVTPKATSAYKGAKPTSPFMKPMTLSPQLAAIIGAEPVARTVVTKKIWEYIKANKLQDPGNKRMICTDDKMKAMFGNLVQISMFDLPGLLKPHMKA